MSKRSFRLALSCALLLGVLATPATAGAIVTTKVLKFTGTVTDVKDFDWYLPGLENGLPINGFAYWDVVTFDDNETASSDLVLDPTLNMFIGPYKFTAGGGFVFVQGPTWVNGWGVQGSPTGPGFPNLWHDSTGIVWDFVNVPVGQPALPGTTGKLWVDGFDPVINGPGTWTYKSFTGEVVASAPEVSDTATLLLMGVSAFGFARRRLQRTER